MSYRVGDNQKRVSAIRRILRGLLQESINSVETVQMKNVLQMAVQIGKRMIDIILENRRVKSCV